MHVCFLKFYFFLIKKHLDIKGIVPYNVQYARGAEYAVDFVGLVDIEVACEYHWSSLCYLANLAHHKFCCLAACHNAHVVHMQVEVVELLLRLFLSDLAPKMCRKRNVQRLSPRIYVDIAHRPRVCVARA